MSVQILGVNLGKNFCSAVGVDQTGEVILRRSMRLQSWLISSPRFRHASLR